MVSIKYYLNKLFDSNATLDDLLKYYNLLRPKVIICIYSFVPACLFFYPFVYITRRPSGRRMKRPLERRNEIIKSLTVIEDHYRYLSVVDPLHCGFFCFFFFWELKNTQFFVHLIVNCDIRTILRSAYIGATYIISSS